MNKVIFSELVDYTLWVNTNVIIWLEQINNQQWEQEIESSFSSIKKTAIHMVSAERIWVDFWQDAPNPVFLSSHFNGGKDDLINSWKATTYELKKLIEAYSEQNLQHSVSFKVRGADWKLDFYQTFFHFVNHATYHRGQLVTLLRQSGFSNLSRTDLAVFYHERQE